MKPDFAAIMAILEKLIQLEEQISDEIKKEADAKKRKKLQKAVNNRDAGAIRDLWFDV